MFKKIIVLLTLVTFILPPAWAQPSPTSESEDPMGFIRGVSIELEMGDLTLETQFIREGEQAIFDGYLFRIEDVAQIKTVLDTVHNDYRRECDARITTLMGDIMQCQTDCDLRTKGLISDLSMTKLTLEDEIKNHALTRKQYMLAGVGSAILASALTGFIVYIVK